MLNPLDDEQLTLANDNHSTQAKPHLVDDSEILPVNDDDDALLLAADDDDDLALVDDEQTTGTNSDKEYWKVMIIDDEPGIHEVIQYSLMEFTFEGKSLHFISGYSEKDAKRLITEHPDTSLVLLDVIMGNKDAGLNVAKYIRTVAKNKMVRIILVTGQPGDTPEEKVIIDYDINGYKAKPELSWQKLFVAVVSALRTYQDLMIIESNHKELSKLYADLEIHRDHLEELVSERTAKLVDEIAHRKKMEIELREAKELADGANLAKSQFLTVMSHELRTPLHAILGFADILLEGLDGELPQNALNSVQLIHNNGKRLLKLIDNLLDMSKMETGVTESAPDVLIANSVINEVMETSSLVANNKSVFITIEASPDLPKIYADKIQLMQILLNLIENAIKFTHKGQVTISAKVDREHIDMMRFSVTDTGIGIDPDKQQQIFERFHQADMSFRREYEGAGMGLAICKELVEMNGGQIGVLSEAGAGSEFYFTIPLADH